MAKQDQSHWCACGLHKVCECQWCNHSRWTDWFPSRNDPLGESHYCQSCGKEESRDIRNGY